MPRPFRDSDLPVDDFDSNECLLVTDLVADLVLWSRDEKIRFEHDLIGDWARTRFLLSRQHEAVSLISANSSNPRWHRAIRLYSLRLLENKALGFVHWSELISKLSSGGKHSLESDLALESVIFATKAEDRLVDIWPRLKELDGVLLTRLLKRFLHVATFPDPRFSELNDPATAAYIRIPFWPLWLPMLRFLHQYRKDALKLSLDQVTNIADRWLTASGEKWPLRNEAAEVLPDALQIAINSIRSDGWTVDGKLCEVVFSRFLSAAAIQPDRVADP